MMRRVRAVLGAAHAGPSAVVTLVTVLLAAVSGLEPWRVVVIGLMMAANQLSIGWSNDALDAARDADAARDDKPVVRGEVNPRTIMQLAVGAAITAVALSLVLGPALAIAHLVALAAGWAYNAGLKRTTLATLCYVVGFGLIPLLVSLAREEPRPAAWWAIAMGGMLGLAAHFANVLPDLEADRRHGIRALPHRLGARRAGAVALVALAASGVLGAVGPGSATTVVTGVGASATVALLVIGIVVLVRAPASRTLFRIIMLAALAAVVTLAGAAGSIVV